VGTFGRATGDGGTPEGGHDGAASDAGGDASKSSDAAAAEGG